MPSTPSLDLIKDLLADGQTEAAADALLQLSKISHGEYYHSALLLKNRLETLQHNIIEGVLSASEERLEWARISKGIVGLVAQIDRGEMPKPIEELIPPAPPKQRSVFSKKIWWAVPVVVLAALFFVPKIIQTAQPGTEKIEVQTPELKTLEGQLIWFDEKPVPNARVSVGHSDKIYEALTGADGFFTLQVDAGLVGKQVDFKVKYEGIEKTETIRLIPENLKRYTLSK